MGTAYTPGLTVNGKALIRKTRRLPLRGDVIVEAGDPVEPQTPIARTELPGQVALIRAADKLGVTGDELVEFMRYQVGDTVQPDDLLAETPGLFGKWFKNKLIAPVGGTIETITARTGNLTIRQTPQPVELAAFIQGVITEVLPHEGAVIETRGALIQGIFGIGGERWGKLKVMPAADAGALGDIADQIVVVPDQVDRAFYRAVAEAGAIGLVAGCILDKDLRAILGYDIGVAITGEEDIPATLILTEGFGDVVMAERTFELLESLQGQAASISGATQIRAGVIRPEIIVPNPGLSEPDLTSTGAEAQILEPGTRIRLIREPYFGYLATVSELPPEPREIETGAKVRVLTARVDGSDEVTVPRANVEIVIG